MGWSCTRCGHSYPNVEGFVDFCPEIKHQGGLGQLGMELSPLVSIYERALRPNFVRSMGRNWDGALTPESEDKYLLDQVTPVAAGFWI